MSDSTYENAPGSGSGGIQSSEELGMGRFSNNDAALASPKAPSFRPEQLNAFRGTGYELIKLHTPRDLDAKGNKIGKAPYKGWRIDAALAVDEAGDAMDGGHNVGVRLRVCDLIVDVDPRNFTVSDDPVKRLEQLIRRSLDAWPTVVTGSGGRHHYMTVPEGFVGMETHPDFPGIEFKRHGRQVVAPGSVHPNTGQPYLWIDDEFAAPVREAGAAPQALLDLILRPVAVSGGDAGECDGEQLAVMLTGLNPEDFSDHAMWLELMMACHHATDGQPHCLELDVTNDAVGLDDDVVAVCVELCPQYLDRYLVLQHQHLGQLCQEGVLQQLLAQRRIFRRPYIEHDATLPRPDRVSTKMRFIVRGFIDCVGFESDRWMSGSDWRKI